MTDNSESSSKSKQLVAVRGNLPALSPDSNLQRYLEEIRRFPMLSEDEEYMLGKRWQEDGDTEAANKLVTSHLRLVAKIASGYRGYGLPMLDLIAEGNIGMIQAVRRYDPDRGFRLATYAMWWIKASIQEYVLRSWSLVKIGTTAAQKKLFFNLKRVKANLHAYEDKSLTPEETKKIAEEIKVSENDVKMMEQRLGGSDMSLNAPIGDGQDEWQDWLAHDTPTQEDVLAETQDQKIRHELLAGALQGLNDRERAIIAARRLSENPQSLEVLSQKFGVSRERIRQIEARAYEKIQAAIKLSAKEVYGPILDIATPD